MQLEARALDCQRAISGRGAPRSVLVAFVLTVCTTTETAAAQRARPVPPQQQAPSSRNYFSSLGLACVERIAPLHTEQQLGAIKSTQPKQWASARAVPHPAAHPADQRRRNASWADYHR